MSGLRGWVWTVAAVAGTATAAALVYRYSTRSLRSDGERGGTGAAQDAATADTSDGEASEYELFSDEEEHTQELEQQQLVLVAREGNMLLSVFGIVLLLLVVSVSLIVTWTSDEPVALTELPMFTPLVWIALGIFTAAAVEMVTHSGAAPSEVPVLADKTVFPHDESDFELIHRHEEAAPAANSSRGNDDRLRQSVDVEEEKEDAPAELTAIVKRADELFAQNNHPGTRSFLRSELPKYPKNIDVLWRLARACNYLVDESSNADEKKALAFEGLAYAEKAYSVDSNSAAANKWMGIMTSMVGNFRDLKDKIAGAYVIRDHIQRAIELDSSDATSHNILGQWCLAFADMTWIEKRAAAALFGTPPTATYAEAIDHFLAAERISPGFWKKNVFLLAQTYAKMKNASEAAVWVKKAYQVPVKTKEDEEVQREAMALMKQLRIPVP